MSENEILSSQRLNERQIKVESQVLSLNESVNRIGAKLGEVDNTLQNVGKALAQLSARPEAKGFSEQIKTVATTASVVMVLASAVFWAIEIQTKPNGEKIDILLKQQAEVIEKNTEIEVHLEYSMKRIGVLEKTLP